MLTPLNPFIANLLIPSNSVTNEQNSSNTLTAANSDQQQGQNLLSSILLGILLAKNESTGGDEANNDDGNQLLEELKEKEQRKCKDLLEEMAQYFLQNAATSFGPLNLTIPESLTQNCTTSSPSFSSASSTSELGSSICESPFGVNFESKVDEVKMHHHQSTVNLNELNAPAAAGHHQRPHRCDQCQKSFRFKSNLFEHKSLHLATSNRNPFVCPFCAKTCRLKGNLKKHLQVHVTSVDDLERLWKRSFSRQSGRPRKNAPPAPLPKPGDDLGLVPVLLGNGERRPISSSSSNSSSSASSSSWRYSPVGPNQQTIQWTFADQFQENKKNSNNSIL